MSEFILDLFSFVLLSAGLIIVSLLYKSMYKSIEEEEKE